MIRSAIFLAAATLAAAPLQIGFVPGALAKDIPQTTEILGEVDFPVSCMAATQPQFNRALASLHSFWYKEAVKSFKAIAESDPGCAMAHWGLAMSSWTQIWAPPQKEALTTGAEAVKKALEIGGKTQREKDYIAAIALFYKDWDKLDHRTRATSYSKAMEQIYTRYPNDLEAAAFYALSLLATADPLDKTYANQIKAGPIAEAVTKARPNHPGAAHYCIHIYDYPALATRGVNAANEYAKLAPSVPHALHMPSHIFVLLGNWQQTIKTNVAAQAAERDRGIPEDRLHALDYIIYAYLQTGQDMEAKLTLDLALQIDEELIAKKYETPFRARPFHAASVRARWALERRQWHEAAQLEPRQSRYPYADSVWHYARAIGLARFGRPDKAKPDLEKLAALRDQLVQAKNGYWALQVDTQFQIASGWTAWEEDKKDAALEFMRAAAKAEHAAQTHDTLNPGPIGTTAREALGEMLIAMNKPGEALLEYEASLKTAPNRFQGLYGAAKSAQLAGRSDTAKAYYTKLVALANNATGERRELAEAVAYLKKK